LHYKSANAAGQRTRQNSKKKKKKKKKKENAPQENLTENLQIHARWLSATRLDHQIHSQTKETARGKKKKN
jgi:hypothetical protein